MSLLMSCQALAKSFGAERLFENISFTVSTGERLGLIGPNGSGKSTLLRILAGEISADEGVVAPRKLLGSPICPNRTNCLRVLRPAVFSKPCLCRQGSPKTNAPGG